MNRKSRFYMGKLPPEEVADVLAKAYGHWGSGAEYLHNTVAHLEEHGIRDRNLWRLQALVAERIPSHHFPLWIEHGAARSISSLIGNIAAAIKTPQPRGVCEPSARALAVSEHTAPD
jgi:ChaC-like protein